MLVFLWLPVAKAGAETRVALVVANAAYAEAPLNNPTVDAELVRTALSRMGFAVTVVKDADLKAFALALQDFYEQARGADLALFYFAGHGFAINGPLGAQNYLMSTSADVTARLDVLVRAQGIALDEIIASLSDAAKVSLVFVDACRNDPRLSRGGRSGRGLTRLADIGAKSMFVGLSTRLGDLAEDGAAGTGSPFARAFAEFMPTPGLRVDDAFRQLRAAVVHETGGAQRPEARDDLAAPLVVVAASAEESAAPDAGSGPGPVFSDPTPTIDDASPPSPGSDEHRDQQFAAAAQDAVKEEAASFARQRAIYYDQGAAGEKGRVSDGTVEWSQVTKDGRLAIEAVVRFAEPAVVATITLSKNYDAALPASHLVEVAFSGSFGDHAVERVPAIVPKRTEQERGQALVGASVKVSSGLFWIALSDKPDDLARNTRSLRAGAWFDLPILFKDQTRALITFEKGGSGSLLFDTVMASWQRAN